jgi:hypothetical protein
MLGVLHELTRDEMVSRGVISVFAWLITEAKK